MDSLLAGIDLCAFPAAPPPDGVIPNLNGPPELGASLVAVSAIMLIWSIAFMGARLWVNIRKLKMSDYFAIIGFVLNTAYIGLMLSMYDYNRHIWDIPACWFDARYMKLFFVEGLLLGITLFFPKAAIMILYLELFSVKKAMRTAVYIGLVFSFLTYLPWIPLAAYYSTPRPGQTWEDLIILQPQMKLSYYGIVQGSLSVLLDIYIFVLPLPILFKLQMAFSRRVQLLVVFATAFMGVIASITALVYRSRVLGAVDVTWQQSCWAIAFVVENSIALIVGCVPACSTFLKLHVTESSFFRSLRSRLLGTKQSSSGQTSKSDYSNPNLRTFGSSRPRQGPYFELNESANLKSNTTSTVVGKQESHSEAPGIVRTLGVYQQHQPHTNQLETSVEKLV